MKLFRLSGVATMKEIGPDTFFGTVLINDEQNEIAAKKLFAKNLRDNSDVDITTIRFNKVEEVKGGFVFATKHYVVSK